MKKFLLKKTLVVIIVILFVGLTIVPIISSINIPLKPIGNPSSKKTKFNPFKEGWKYRKMITIDHNKVAGNLVNFPVLISTIDPDLRDKAQSDGDDILFMNHPGKAEQLFHEIEFYDGASGELVTWANIPSISSRSDTKFYMYYGNPECSSQQFPEKTWDSDYLHVWHLDESLEDSAGTDDGNDHGTSIISGKIGNARDFERDEQDYIDFGDMNQPSDSTLTTMTWEGWIKPETQDIIIMSKYDSSGRDYSSYNIWFIKGGKFHIQANSQWDWYGRTVGITDDNYSVVGQWIYLTGTYNLGGINDIDAFINGDEVSLTQDFKNGDVMWDIPVTDDLGRTRHEKLTHYTDAVIDEVRWSKTVRSDDWIKTSFNTMNGPSSFLTFDCEMKPRSKSYANLLFQQFLQNHPNLFPLLQKLLLLIK